MRLKVVTLSVCLVVAVVGSLEAQTIYFKKDHIYAGAEGKELAIVTPPTTDATAPTTPSSITVPNLSSTWIQLSWTGSTDSGGSSLAGYKIYRAQGSGAALPVGTVGPSTTTFTDQPLQLGQTYIYR